MPRPEILLTNTGIPGPATKLDPRYHPLGQPGARHKGPVWICKIPPGFRLWAMVFGYCFVTWNVRHWLYPHGARTVHNVRIPIHDEKQVEAVWNYRFRIQKDIYRWGHIYAKMQEERIREAKRSGVLPEDYPENEEQLNRLDHYEPPEIEKIRFDVGVDRHDGVNIFEGVLPPGYGLKKD
eukprot:231685_1